MDPKRKWSRTRVLLLIVSGVVAFASVLYLWGFPTANYLVFRQRAKRSRILRYKPIALPNTAVNQNSGMTLVQAGLSFEVPWTDLNREKSKVIGKWAIFSFDSGIVITFCPPSTDGEDLRDVVTKNFGMDHDKFATTFGLQAQNSNYAFHRALLSTSLSDLRPWMGSRESMRTGMVLTIKAISSVGGDTGLYAVAANDWKGFQFDDPSRIPRAVTLELYDPQDKHVEISIAHRLDMQNSPTQAEVNRVLQTLRWSDLRDTLLGNRTDTKAVAAR